MNPIKFGFIMPTQWRDRGRRASYTDDLNHALTLIAGHFESAWAVDHLQFDDMDMLEGFTTLAYMAGQHPQLKFGHTVLCHSFRNPALLAKMGATLHYLTGGRFILGLGSGWHEEEYRSYGYDFPPDRVRIEQLEETIQIVRALWTQERASFAGKYYHISDAYCEPRPDPPPPLLIGAFGPKMLRLAARYADEWNVSSTGPVKYARLAAEFGRACADVGRDPATVRRSWVGGCAVAATHEAAVALGGDRVSAEDEDDFGFVGTPDQVVAQLRRFIDLGVDTFMLDCADFPQTAGLELLIEEVLPAMQGG